MKMKQKLAATLAGVMAVSMVPATSVFASSENSVTRKAQVATSYTGATYLEGKSTLVIKTTGKIETGDTIILNSSHEWYGAEKGDSATMMTKKEADIKKMDIPDTAKWVYLTHKDSKKVVQIKYVGDNPLDGETLEIPVQAKIGAGSTGDITITVKGNGTIVDDSTHVVATVVGEGVTAKIGSNPIKEGASSADLPKITLTEATAGMFKANSDGKVKTSWITLKLKSTDVKFVPYEAKDGESEFGSTTGKRTVTVKYSEMFGTVGKVSGSSTTAYISDDGMSLFVPVNMKELTSSEGTLYITAGSGAKVYKNEDVEYIGTAKVDILDGWVEDGKTDVSKEAVGISNVTNATIVTQVEQGVKITVSSAPELIAGRLVAETDLIAANIEGGKTYSNYGNATHLTAKVSVREDIIDSIDGEVKFTFPEGVKVLGIRTAKKDRVDSIVVNGEELVKLGTEDNEYTTVPYITTGYFNIVDRFESEYEIVNNELYSLSTVNASGEITKEYYKKITDTYYNSNEDGDTLSEATLTDAQKKSLEFVKDVDGKLNYNSDTTSPIFTKGIDKVVVEVPENRTAAVNLDIEFYLSVSADYEDDTVDVEVETNINETGEKIEEVVTVAKVVKPVEIKAESKVLDENLKKQEVGDITITENFAGALVAGGKVYIDLEDIAFTEDMGEVVVESGDVSVSKLKWDDNGNAYFTVSGNSTKASTIKVKGLQVDTRKMAGGYYELKVYGTPIAANDIMTLIEDNTSLDLSTDSKREKEAKKTTKYFNAGALVVEDYVTINRELLNSDKAPEANNKVEKVTVTIADGSTKYTRADGTTGTMVAPTYRPVDGITMVSVRAIPEMLGADVEYSAESKTVTITMPDGKYAQVTLDSVVGIDINGRTVMMNYKAEIPEGKDGGIYVPLRYFGRLLGLADEDITYDTATKSVVISYDKVVK